MAYQKQGFFNDMTPGQKRGIVILSIILVIVLALGISYWHSPRDFMRRFMTKQTYGEWILKKEAEKDIPELKKWTGEITKERASSRVSSAEIRLSDQLRQQIGTTPVLFAVDNYISSLTIKSNVNIAGNQAFIHTQVSDRAAPVMTIDFARTGDFSAFNVKELGLGWQKINNSKTEDAEYKSAGGPAVEIQDPRRVLFWSVDDQKMNKLVKKNLKKGYKEIRRDIKIEIDPDETFELSGKKTEGLRILYSVPIDTFLEFIDVSAENMMSDKKLYDAWNSTLSEELKFKSFQDYQSFIQSAKRTLENNLSKSGTTGVAVSLYVDNKNMVTAAEALVKNKNNDLIARAIFRDENNSGPAVRIRYGKNGIYSIVVTREGKQKGIVDFKSGDFERTISYSDYEWYGGHLYGNFKWTAMDLPISKDGKKIPVSNTLSLLRNGKDGQQINLTVDIPSIGKIAFETVSEKGKYVMPDLSGIKDASPANTDAITEAATRYFTRELPVNDPEYGNLVKQIIRSKIPADKVAANVITERQQERRQFYQLLMKQYLAKRAENQQKKLEETEKINNSLSGKKESNEDKETTSESKTETNKEKTEEKPVDKVA